MPSKKYARTQSGKLIPHGSDVFDEYVEGWNDCIDSLKKDFIPIEFIDKQIEHFQMLFESNLCNNDDYDLHYRMMVDSLRLLKRRWKKYER